MIVLVNTHILIDVALDRRPQFIDVAPTTTESLRYAAAMDMKNFETAMQVAAAMACGAEIIATRNIKDYVRSPVTAVKPVKVLSRLFER